MLGDMYESDEFDPDVFRSFLAWFFFKFGFGMILLAFVWFLALVAVAILFAAAAGVSRLLAAFGAESLWLFCMQKGEAVINYTLLGSVGIAGVLVILFIVLSFTCWMCKAVIWLRKANMKPSEVA